MTRIKVVEGSGTPERPPGVAYRYAACLLVCPVASAVLLIAGDQVWGPLVSVSSLLTVALLENLEGVRATPGQVAEAIRLILAASLSAIAPALAMGLFERTWTAKAAAVAALYPAWLGVMIAPAVVVHHSSRHLDASLLSAHLTSNFLVAFSALATSAALAFAFWVRLHPETYRGARG